MHFIIFFVVCITLVIGLLAKYLLDRFPRLSKGRNITWTEYGITSAVIIFILAPGITALGWWASKRDMLTFKQDLNGWELAVVKEEVTCTRDGPCNWEYDCDPYIVMVPYSCGTSKHPQTCYRPETRYHHCPYVDHEYNYYVKTTLGDYTFHKYRFPVNPQEHRWRKYHDIPYYVIERAGVGDPQDWLDVKKRVDTGTNGPVTTRDTYENFIYASDTTILKAYSQDIIAMKDAGLLPMIPTLVYEHYSANRVSFVKIFLRNEEEWQKKLAYFNAALGSERQGNIYLVIVNSAEVKEPDNYMLALKAYWANYEIFQMSALSKNAIVVVLGTDGQTVSWAKAFTGMPLGNEEVIVSMSSNLKGVPLTADSIIGDVSWGGSYLHSKHGNGILEKIVFGLDATTGFKRISMTGKSGEGSGFLYLEGQIEPRAKAKKIIIITALFFCVVSWGISIAVDKWRR